MMRLVAATSMAVLFAIPVVSAMLGPIVVVGAIGALLAIAGIVTLRRWAITAAAFVFLADYAFALAVADTQVSIVTATAFGLALLLQLHAVEVARSARGATVDRRFLRSQVAGWLGFAAATLGGAIVVTALARGAAGAIPHGLAPLAAAAGALGVVVWLAREIIRGGRRA